MTIIEIYYADLQCLKKEKNREKAAEILCDTRMEKINKYKREEDKLRSMAAGLLLEYGLRKQGLSQRFVHFTTEKNGKPKILEKPELYFNLTHSGEYAAAVFADTEVGIDLEQFREKGEKVAKRFFTKEEQLFFSEHKDASSFTRIWTRKESYMKATGLGSRIPLDSFSTVEKQVRQKTEEFMFQEEGQSLNLKKQKLESYYLQSYDIIPNYWISVCTKDKTTEALMEKIDLTTFFC